MGTNEIANPNVDSNVGLQDELGMEALVQAKEQLEKEFKIFSDNKADLEKGKINFSKQWDVDKRYRKIINESKGVSAEAFVKMDNNQAIDGELLGFSFNVKTTPADNFAGVLA